jgi:hypothetical protein
MADGNEPRKKNLRICRDAYVFFDIPIYLPLLLLDVVNLPPCQDDDNTYHCHNFT